MVRFPIFTVFVQILVILLITSCASKKPIRSVKEFGRHYKGGQPYSIDFFLDASVYKNRDIIASSIYYLGEVLHDFEENEKKWKFASEEEKEATKDKIIDQLFKLYSINSDFNLKLLIMDALGNVESDQMYNFFLECLRESDIAIVKKALIKIRPYVGLDKYDTGDGLEQIKKLMEGKHELISLIAVDTLFYFAPDDKILKIIEDNKEIQTKDVMRRIFEEKIVKYRESLQKR